MAMQDTGFDVRHSENLREHYALTLRDWCANLETNWDACVDEVGEGTARVWGLYMAASRLSFERNGIQLHQVLAVKPGRKGDSAGAAAAVVVRLSQRISISGSSTRSTPTCRRVPIRLSCNTFRTSVLEAATRSPPPDPDRRSAIRRRPVYDVRSACSENRTARLCAGGRSTRAAAISCRSGRTTSWPRSCR